MDLRANRMQSVNNDIVFFVCVKFALCVTVVVVTFLMKKK